MKRKAVTKTFVKKTFSLYTNISALKGLTHSQRDIDGNILILNINPCPAGPGYIRFQGSLNPNKMPLKLMKYSVVDAELIKYFNLGDVYFS